MYNKDKKVVDKMKVLCIGESLYEITCPLDTPIIENTRIDLNEIYKNGGGNAGNIAYLLSKWGIEVYISSMLGADDNADKIKKEYEAIGVQTNLIETSYDKTTKMELVLVNKKNKTETKIYIGQDLFAKKYVYNIDVDTIITDGVDYNATLAAFDKFSASKKYLIMNKLSNETSNIAKYVNYLIIDEKVAEQMANIKIDFNNSATIVNIYNFIKQRYSNIEIIISLDNKGCVYSINGQIKIMPSLKIEKLDNNGAFSVFTGSFAYCMEKGFGLEKALAYATIASSLTATKLTSRLAIPSLVDVSNYYDSKFGKVNNPNITNSQNQTVNMSTTESQNDNIKNS